MKKINNISAIICSLLLLLTVNGCKDFLDVTVPGRLQLDEFYKTDNDAELAVIEAYDMMQRDYNSNWQSMIMVKTMPSDESNAGGSNSGDQPAYQELNLFQTTPLNNAVGAVWEKCYGSILRCNLVINRIKPEESTIKARAVAEAKFIRALNYFDLVSLWGDVPLVLDIVPKEEYRTKGRADKTKIYELIENDLKEAMAVLPLKSAYALKDKFRASKGAAEALLGKVYLYQQKWGDAVTHFENVITSNEYQLANSVGEAFSRSQEFGKESLFEISYSNRAGYDWGNFPWGNIPESNIHIQLWGPRGDSGYKKATADSLLGGWGMNIPTKKMWDAYIAANDEARRKQTLMSIAELRAGGGEFTDTPTPPHQFQGYFQRKYGAFETQSSTAEGAVLELNYGTNWRLIRYADVVLMAAEANYKAGGAGEARALLLLNQLRGKRSVPDVVAVGPALFNAIVRERQLELSFEGHRFLDLVRWGLAEQELGTLGFKKGTHELLPIPNNEVITADLKQNPGY